MLRLSYLMARYGARRRLSALISVALILVVAACSTSSTVSVRHKSATIKGYVVDGPIVGATVQAYSYAKGVKGALLGTTQTDREGFYSLRLPYETDTIILVEARSGYYVEDASSSSAVVELGPREFLRTVAIIQPENSNWVHVTPFTLLASGLAEFELAEIARKSSTSEFSREQVRNAIQTANASFSRLLGGIDILGTPPLRAATGGMADMNPGTTMPHAMSASGGSDSHVYSLFNGAFSHYAKTISEMSNAAPFTSFTAIGLARLMYDDIVADGVLDGKTLVDKKITKQILYGAERLDSTHYRKYLGEGMLQLANARQAETIAPFEQIMHKAHFFAESQDALFGNGEHLPFDNQPPKVSAFTRVGYDKALGIVRYRIDAADPVGIHNLAVSVENRTYNTLASENEVKLPLNEIGPGEHTAVVTAMDVLGNTGTTEFQVIMPDGKPIATLSSSRLTNNAAYVARGDFIDDAGNGIASIAITTNGVTSNADVDLTRGRWNAPLTLTRSDNTLLLRVTDNKGLSRETTYHIILDTQGPTYVPRPSNAEFIANGEKRDALLTTASGGGDPLYVPATRVGFPDPMAKISDFSDQRIPYLILDVNDESTDGTVSLTMKYSVNGQVKAAPRLLRPSLANKVDNATRYVIPLIREILSEKWYQSEPTDIHTLDLGMSDAAGNTANYTLTFKAFFDLPSIRVHSNVKGAMVHGHEFGSGAAGGQIGGCTTNDKGNCLIRVLPEPMLAHFKLMDGAYLEPATGVQAPLRMGEILSSVVDFKGSDIDVAITPYSHQATGLLEYTMKSASDARTVYQTTLDSVREVYGLNVFTTVPDNAATLNLATSGYTPETRYALLLGALSAWTASRNVQQGYAPHTIYTSVGAAQAFYLDTLADGLFDGKGVDENGVPITLNFGNTPLDANIYRYELANQLIAFAGGHYSLTNGVQELVALAAQDVADNSSKFFGGLNPRKIDIRLPVVSLVSPNTTQSPAYRATVRVAPGVSPISRVTINGITATSAGIDWSINMTLANQGRNSLDVRTYSPAGAEVFNTVFFVIFDNIAPTLRIESPSSLANLTSTAATYMLEGTATDTTGIARVTVRVGGKSWDVTSEHWMAHIELVPGVNSVTVEAADAIGNTATQQFNVSFIPKVTLDPIPPARSTGDRPQFRGTVEAIGIAYSLRATLYLWQNTAWVALNTTPANVVTNANGAWTLDFFTSSTLRPLVSGQYKLSLTLTSNGASSSSDFLFVVDKIPPSITPVSPLANTRDNPYTLTFDVKDDSGPVTSVTVNGDPAIPQANNRWTYNPPKQPNDGIASFNISARDDLGNSSSTTHNVTLDTLGPALVVTQPVNNAWVKTPSVALTISVSDPTPPVATSVNIEGISITPNALGQYALQKEGANNVVVTATDGLGNGTSRSLVINRDSLPPDIVTTPTVLAPYTKSPAVSFSVSAIDAYSAPVLTVADNGVAQGTYGVTGNTATWSNSSIALVEGTNTITVSAQDALSNVAPTKTFTIIRDTVAPTLANANTGASFSTSATAYGVYTNQNALKVNATDSASGSGIDNVTFSGGGAVSPRVITVGAANVYTDTDLKVTDGTFTYNVVVTDKAGNASPATTVTYIYDKTVPATTISSSFTATSSSFLVKGTTTETYPNLITITATNTNQKGKVWTTTYSGVTQWSLTVTGLTTGSNTFSVVASDKAGNSSTKSITIRR